MYLNTIHLCIVTVWQYLIFPDFTQAESMPKLRRDMKALDKFDNNGAVLLFLQKIHFYI